MADPDRGYPIPGGGHEQGRNEVVGQFEDRLQFPSCGLRGSQGCTSTHRAFPRRNLAEQARSSAAELRSAPACGDILARHRNELDSGALR